MKWETDGVSTDTCLAYRSNYGEYPPEIQAIECVRHGSGRGEESQDLLHDAGTLVGLEKKLSVGGTVEND